MAILFSPWFWLAVALAACGVATHGWINEKAAFDSFKGAQAALAKAADDRRLAIIKSDKSNLEQTNADLAKTKSDNADLLKRLRSAPRVSALPAAPATSKRPDLACFDRAEYQPAYGAIIERLRAGARGLADEGTANTIDLNSAKQWAGRMSTTLSR